MGRGSADTWGNKCLLGIEVDQSSECGIEDQGYFPFSLSLFRIKNDVAFRSHPYHDHGP
jgi:hypothetical protein